MSESNAQIVDIVKVMSQVENKHKNDIPAYIKAEATKLKFFDAVKDIILLFVEQEIGTSCEINYEMVASYVSSDRFAIDTFDKVSKEDIYQMVTDDILSGLPIWNYVILPEYKMKILQHAYDMQLEKERKALEEKYKCYTCKYYEAWEGSFGYHESCKAPSDTSLKHRREFRLKRSENIFTLKEECDKYINKNEVD